MNITLFFSFFLFLGTFASSFGSNTHKLINTGRCSDTHGCSTAGTRDACTSWATDYFGKAMSAKNSINDNVPEGCYVFHTTQVWFNDGSKNVTDCTSSRSCLCECGAAPAPPSPPPPSPPPSPSPTGKEYHVITSGVCGALNGCTAAESVADCGTWGSHVAEVKNASVSSSVNAAPLGCYLYGETGKLWFNDGTKATTSCSTDRKCLCQCSPAVDVAFYDDKGASSRGKVNIWEVLNYRSDIRAHNFSADEVRRFLHVENYDVIFFPGGGGGTEEKTIGSAGQLAVKDFLARGGGYVGVCAGAYLALDALKIAPFKNLHKYYGNRGDGNCSLALSPGSGLSQFGVGNNSLATTPIFYGGGPVMEASSVQHPNVSDPRIHALFTRPVPWRVEKKPPYPSNASDYKMGIGLAAVVSATYAGKGTVVVVGPHPETDEMDFPHRHGPPAVKGGVRATLLQSFVRYAAAAQPQQSRLVKPLLV